ncbi:MAG: uracil-DNA glycosylase [Phycisphaerae bacterium]|nr:uracil-DNA glycosylase [Phycisphaerae bacterium]
MDTAAARRIARQNLRTDQLLGLGFVPLGTKPPQPLADEPAPPQIVVSAPQAPSPTSDVPPPMPVKPTAGLAPGQKQSALDQLAIDHEANCPHCSVNRGRLNMVFGEGEPDARLMFVGEGPGRDEDRLGRPFVGRAGKLLDKQIQAMGLAREQVYIANIVKRRPPGNRVPTPEEAALCMPYLLQQIEIIRPQVIVSLGATSAKYLLDDPRLKITKERGQWKKFRGINLMPTLHPAYLLRQYTPENRKRVWDDLKKVLQVLGLEVPDRS